MRPMLVSIVVAAGLTWCGSLARLPVRQAKLRLAHTNTF